MKGGELKVSAELNRLVITHLYATRSRMPKRRGFVDSLACHCKRHVPMFDGQAMNSCCSLLGFVVGAGSWSKSLTPVPFVAHKAAAGAPGPQCKTLATHGGSRLLSCEIHGPRLNAGPVAHE